VNLSTGTFSYLVSDLLGSVRGIVNSSGTLTATTAYDAWGNPETTGGLTSYTPFGYAGAYTDPTGLIYLINRYYDPATGQFLSVDPLLNQTHQAFAYGGGNPVSQTDPSGQRFIACPFALFSLDRGHYTVFAEIYAWCPKKVDGWEGGFIWLSNWSYVATDSFFDVFNFPWTNPYVGIEVDQFSGHKRKDRQVEGCIAPIKNGYLSIYGCALLRGL